MPNNAVPAPIFGSRPLYHGADLAVLLDDTPDKTAGERTSRYLMDPKIRLAKVGVAGSNPVVRSR